MSRKRNNDRPPAASSSVGYGRPPVEHQFKPGISGNPSGRPKGSPTIQDLIAREARRLVKVRTGDKITSISKLEALVRKLFAQALEGDLSASRLIMQSSAVFTKGPTAATDEEVIDPSTVDEEALMRMLARFEDYRSESDQG